MNMTLQAKRILDIGIVAVSLLIASGCYSHKDYKTDIFHMVNEYSGTFLEDITESDFSDTLELEGIDSVETLETGVNFYCGGYGNAASSHEFGFYYSVQDQPMGIWGDAEFCHADEMTKDGNGFSAFLYENPYYTEKICDHFYYYELHF